MSTYRIITDSSCDMTQEMADRLGLTVVPMTVRVQDREYRNFLDGRELNVPEFYTTLRTGVMTSTAAVNPSHWDAVIRPVLEAGEDALVLAFSSGLSTTANSACIAAQELREEFPDRKVYVVDTLCASLGQGLLVWYAAKKQQEGASLEEVHHWVEDNKLHLCHFFTVDDLFFLKRGGRVSGAAAVMGSLLQIKPVLHVDDEGHLIPLSKARGRRASIQALAAKVGELAFDPSQQTMFISHGDCLADAEYLADLIKKDYNVPEVHINFVGPVIGSHSGPGTLALFFLGEHR